MGQRHLEEPVTNDGGRVCEHARWCWREGGGGWGSERKRYTKGLEGVVVVGSQ